MGWFDEQIHQRKNADEEAFSESFRQIAGAIMGRRMSDALNDNRRVTTDAIEEILNYYHVSSCEVPESIKDMNEVLEYLMRPYGIMRRNVRLDKGWYNDAVGAMLGVKRDDKNVVALLPDKVFGYRYFDRTLGKSVRISHKNENLFEDEAIAFYKPFPLTKMGIGSLAKYICEQVSVSDLVLLCISMLVITLIGMITPRMNAALFSSVLASKNGRILIGAGIYLLAASISQLMFGVVRTLINLRINTKLDINIEAAAMMRMLSLPADFFKKYNSGELANRIGYINSLSNQIVSIVLSTTLSSLFSLMYIGQIFYFAPGLVAPAMTITLLTLVVTLASVFLQMRITKQQMLLSSKESGVTYALISGIQKLRLSGSEKRAFGRWGMAYAKQAQLLYNPPLFLKVSSVISTAISLIGSMVMYFYAIKTGISVAQYYAFNSAYGMVSGAFMSLSGIISSIALIRPSLEMAKPLLETVPEIAEDKEVITSLKGGVELNNITFRYNENMPDVIDNLSLKIDPGQYVAIVGKTGCGKSTLMRLMLGFETPQKGAIYYDGKDIKRIDLKSLRQKIGAVMQNGKLFTGDIYSNIVITAPWLTVDDAWSAARIAGLEQDIKDMPMGMNTMISEGQGGISGGQKQRLMIARAVAPKPRILMFDEATSALDNITQRQVSESLDQMKCTRIVIAHRLSTIKQCDRIIVIDGGKIIEDGTYEELIAMKGFFADLVSRQQLEEGE